MIGSKRVGFYLHCTCSVGKPCVSHTYHMQNNKIGSTSHDAGTHFNFEFLIYGSKKTYLEIGRAHV